MEKNVGLKASNLKVRLGVKKGDRVPVPKPRYLEPVGTQRGIGLQRITMSAFGAGGSPPDFEAPTEKEGPAGSGEGRGAAPWKELEGRKSDEEQDGMRSTTFGQFGTRKVILAKLLHYGSKTNLI